MSVNEREIAFLRGQVLYYKGKCEVYEAFLSKAGLIKDHSEIINKMNEFNRIERIKND